MSEIDTLTQIMIDVVSRAAGGGEYFNETWDAFRAPWIAWDWETMEERKNERA